MRDVEQGSPGAAVLGRVHDAVFVLDGHRPAGERHHLAPVLDVEVVERGLAQVRVVRVPPQLADRASQRALEQLLRSSARGAGGLLNRLHSRVMMCRGACAMRGDAEKTRGNVRGAGCTATPHPRGTRRPPRLRAAGPGTQQSARFRARIG